MAPASKPCFLEKILPVDLIESIGKRKLQTKRKQSGSLFCETLIEKHNPVRGRVNFTNTERSGSYLPYHVNNTLFSNKIQLFIQFESDCGGGLVMLVRCVNSISVNDKGKTGKRLVSLFRYGGLLYTMTLFIILGLSVPLNLQHGSVLHCLHLGLDRGEIYKKYSYIFCRSFFFI